MDILLKDKYFQTPPPKSTGPESFNLGKLNKIINLENLPREREVNLLATLTYFTARCIYDEIRRYSAGDIQELYVSGGGVHNLTLMAFLRELFTSVPVLHTDTVGIPGDAKEAMCFAVLANETLHGNPGNLASATGASRPVVLGKICQP